MGDGEEYLLVDSGFSGTCVVGAETLERVLSERNISYTKNFYNPCFDK